MVILRMAAAALIAVSGNGPSVAKKLKVVATTPDFAALAREIGGDAVEFTALAKPTEDPHYVDANPSHIVTLNRADVLIEGGAELEIGWLPPLLDGARNPKLAPGAPGRISCSRGIQMLEVPATLDRSKGDIHAAGNPHYMMDPLNTKIVAENIATAFAQLEPRSSEVFQANLGRFTTALEARLAGWQKLLESFKGQRVVSYHNSWPYFSQRFGLRVDLFLEPKPGIPPSPAHLAAVVAKMKDEKIRAIFVEPHLNRRTAETVARSTGATVVEVSQFPGGFKGTESGYLALMDANVRALAKALSAQ
ncbi:MAG: metal ABC transporter substrate-binding protein [Terriglobales bacterium]